MFITRCFVVGLGFFVWFDLPISMLLPFYSLREMIEHWRFEGRSERAGQRIVGVLGAGVPSRRARPQARARVQPRVRVWRGPFEQQSGFQIIKHTTQYSGQNRGVQWLRGAKIYQHKIMAWSPEVGIGIDLNENIRVTT